MVVIGLRSVAVHRGNRAAMLDQRDLLADAKMRAAGFERRRETPKYCNVVYSVHHV